MAVHDDRYEFVVELTDGLGAKLYMDGPGVEQPVVSLGNEATLETLLDLEIAVRGEADRLLRERHLSRDEMKINAWIKEYEAGETDDG